MYGGRIRDRLQAQAGQQDPHKTTDPKTVAKLTKFAAKMGFTPHGVFDCLDGNPRLVHLRWDKAS